MQLHEEVLSVYCRVSYSMLGMESDSKVQTRMICLFILVGVEQSVKLTWR